MGSLDVTLLPGLHIAKLNCRCTLQILRKASPPPLHTCINTQALAQAAREAEERERAWLQQGGGAGGLAGRVATEQLAADRELRSQTDREFEASLAADRRRQVRLSSGGGSSVCAGVAADRQLPPRRQTAIL